MSLTTVPSETQIFRRLGPKPPSAARGPQPATGVHLDHSGRAIAQLRRDLHALMRGEGSAESPDVLANHIAVLVDMYQVLHNLHTDFALLDGRPAGRLITAMEEFAGELRSGTGSVSASAVRTLAQGVDLLAHVLEGQAQGIMEHGAAPFVLVVDDEPLSRRLANLCLQRVGLAHISLDSTQEAAEILQRQHFDLILLDMHMPDVDGCELCRRLRKMPLHAATPVVFVTGCNDLKARAQASLSGGTDFIGKPFHSGELGVKALSHILRARSARTLGDTAIFSLAGHRAHDGHPTGTVRIAA